MSSKLLKILALLCVAVLALSGCSLVRVDETAENAQVVASFNGGNLTKGEVVPLYESNKEYFNYLASLGYPVDMDGLLMTLVDELVREKVILCKAEEKGISLTADEEAAAQEEATATYEETMQSYWSSYAVDGLTDDEIRADIEVFFAASGYTPEAVLKDTIESKIIDKVRQSVYDSVIITPEDVQNAYNDQVLADQTNYSADTFAFEQATLTPDTLIAWMPEGYRTVKHILVLFTDEQSAAISELNLAIADLEAKLADLDTDATTEVTATPGEAAAMLTAADIEQLIAFKKDQKDALVAEYAAAMQPTFDKIYAELDSGKEFAAVMDDYNEDPGMDTEPALTTGYFVSDTSEILNESFRAGAMALENVGDVSEPVLADYGAHIIYYLADVTPGAVPYAEVSDVIESQVTQVKQANAYDETVELWVKDAGVTIDLSSIEK